MQTRALHALLTAGMLAVLLRGAASCTVTSQAQEPNAVIDDCRYTDDMAARAVWRPMSGSLPVSVAVMSGEKTLRLPCPFAGNRVERASWDRSIQLDLSACQGVQFQFFCRDASPVSYFSLYFESGGGWYTAPFYPQSSGWNTIMVDKADMKIEGKPDGWDTIKTVRLSAWRGADTDTEFHIRDLRMTGLLGVDTLIALVRCDSAAGMRPEEVRSVQQFTANVAKCFEELGVGCATLSDTNLTAVQLRRAKLVVLPHNPTMPAQTEDELIAFLGAGGKLLAFYGMPARLRPVTHIDTSGYVKPERPGAFAVMHFEAEALEGAPSRVKQKSWNIVEPKPVPGFSRIVGQWMNENGQSAGHVAAVASSNAVEMSHVALRDDPIDQRRLLLALAGHLVPDIWRQAADRGLGQIGRLAGFRDYAEADAEISRAGGHEPRVTSLLADARRQRESAMKARAEGRFPEAHDRARDAAKTMLDAYCAAQRPVAGEFRAFWCHSAFGVEGMNWDAAALCLATNGFAAILPNMLWGGVAYYQSSVLPVAPEVATRGDQLAECLAACRKHGLQVHVWKVNWNLSRAPNDFVGRMRREGRLQADVQGKEEPWLCPSHPENQKLEIDSMVEVVRRYDVDGIHFDYIRYPDGDHCFCAGCRERFSRTSGATAAKWPRDVLKGGSHYQAWLDWRRENITKVVKAVSEQTRALKPGVKLSAAVFNNWTADRDTVGQDWKLWCERGYLDFVCPMDYTASDAQFDNWVTQQKRWAGSVPCYPGIGAWVLTPDRVIGQIQIARKHNTRGFVVFNYDANAARNLAPKLGAGATKK